MDDLDFEGIWNAVVRVYVRNFAAQFLLTLRKNVKDAHEFRLDGQHLSGVNLYYYTEVRKSKEMFLARFRISESDPTRGVVAKEEAVPNVAAYHRDTPDKDEIILLHTVAGLRRGFDP